MKVMQLSNGELLAFGRCYLPSISGHCFALFYMDNVNGSLIREKLIRADGCILAGAFDSKSIVIETSSNQLLISGSCYFSNVLVLTNLAGNIIWSKETALMDPIPFTSITGGGAQSVIEHNSGYFYSCGSAGQIGGYSFIYKFNNLGDPVWQKMYQFDSLGFVLGSLIELPNGNLLGAGLAQGYFGFPTGSALMELDTSGNIIWAKTYDQVFYDGLYVRNLILLNDSTVVASFGGAFNDPLTNIIIDTSGTLISFQPQQFNITDSYANFGLFQNRFGGFTNVSDATNSSGDTVTIELVQTGTDLVKSCWTFAEFPIEHDFIGTYTDTNLIIMAPIVDTVNRSATLAAISWTRSEICLAVTGIKENLRKTGIHAYPNPTDGLLNVNFDNKVECKAENFSLVNIAGQSKRVVLSSFSSNNKSAIIDFSSLSKGLYFLSYTNQRESVSIKIIKL
jgi:hypothetical protein